MLVQVLFFIMSATLTFIFFLYGFNHYYLLTASRKYKVPHEPKIKGELPPVCIHLPIYNEKYVIGRLVAACVKIAERYGRDKVRIMILDDSTDDTIGVVDKIVSDYASQGYGVEVLRRPNRQGFKAGALQAALEKTPEEYIAIFDADFIPESDFLNRTIPYFEMDDHVGIVQSRWCHLNRDFNMLTFAVAIGIDIHFGIEQTARFANGLFQNFNGSGGVLRKKAVTEVGGWESDTLTEDLDLSYRMQLNDYRVVYLRDIDSPAEIPPTVPSFKQQQGRWANGSLRTAKKILPIVFRKHGLGLNKRFQAFLHLTGYLIHPLMTLSFLLSVAEAFFNINGSFPAQAQIVFHSPPVAAIAYSSAMAFSAFQRSFWTALGPLIVLCTIGPWISSISIMRIQKFPFLRNLTGFFILLLLGLGLSLSNTFEIFKGFFSKKTGEFVRTPKYAHLENSKGWQKRNYQTPFKPIWAVEFVFICMGISAFIYGFIHQNYAPLLLLAVFTISYIFIFVQTILQSRRA